MLIFTISVAVVGYIGYKTYQFAPPIADFKGVSRGSLSSAPGPSRTDSRSSSVTG